MGNQSGMSMWTQLREKIWGVLVRAGRRNGLLRMMILAVTAVYLFCRHLYRNAKTVSAMRYACLFCAGLLALNCVNAPVWTWAFEQDAVLEDGADQSVGSGSLEIEVSGPEFAIVEGYEDTVPYRIQLTNPEDGTDLTELRVSTSNYSNVYALVWNAETGTEEEILVFRHPEEGNLPLLLGEPGEDNPEEGSTETPEGPEESDPEEGSTETPEEPEESDPEEGSTETPEGPGEDNPEEGSTETPEGPGEDNPEEGSTETPEEPGEDNPEEGSTETPEEPGEPQGPIDESGAMRLARGESLTYIVRIPTGLPAGEYTETVIFQAKELNDPIKRMISFIVKSADEETEPPTESDPTETEPPTESEPTGTEPPVESDPTETEPPTESEPTETEPPVESDPTEAEPPTEGGEPTETEPSTEGEPTEGEEDGEKEDSGEKAVQETKLEIVSREGGYYMGNTFFAMSAAGYELKAELPEGFSLFCDLNGVSSELSVVDGYASYTLPETYNGEIRFLALGQDGNVTEEITEYVIAENMAPDLEYVNVMSPTDGACKVHVSIEDRGEIISGLNNTECMVDGVLFTGYTPNVFGKVLLCSGEEAVSGFSFDIPLQDNEIHTIEIIVADNAGNVLKKSFRVNAPQTDVISVVLPTSFGMAVFPRASNGNIWGEDIVVANQSEFPVEVTLKSTQVHISREEADNGVKDAKLNLNLNLSDGRSSALELQEGYSMPGECFILEPKNPETDAVALQNDAKEKSVISGDYAIANIRGTIAEGSEDMWGNGDITVALTFTFRRVGGPIESEEAEKPEETEKVEEPEDTEKAEEPEETEESTESMEAAEPEETEEPTEPTEPTEPEETEEPTEPMEPAKPEEPKESAGEDNGAEADDTEGDPDVPAAEDGANGQE